MRCPSGLGVGIPPCFRRNGRNENRRVSCTHKKVRACEKPAQIAKTNRLHAELPGSACIARAGIPWRTWHGFRCGALPGNGLCVRPGMRGGRICACGGGRSAPHEQWLNAGIAASRRPCRSVTGCSSWHLGDGPVHHALSPGGARACRRSVRKVRRRCRQAGPMLAAGTPRTGAPPCKPGGWRPGMARPAATASMTRMYASTRECLSWRIDAWGYAMATLCWGGCVASTTCQGGTGRIDPADRRVWRAGHGRRGAKRQS